MAFVTLSVFDCNHEAYARRSEELTYVAKAIMAGCAIQGRPFTTQEAWDAAVAVCNVGMENWPRKLLSVLREIKTFLHLISFCFFGKGPFRVTQTQSAWREDRDAEVPPAPLFRPSTPSPRLYARRNDCEETTPLDATHDIHLRCVRGFINNTYVADSSEERIWRRGFL